MQKRPCQHIVQAMRRHLVWNFVVRDSSCVCDISACVVSLDNSACIDSTIVRMWGGSMPAIWRMDNLTSGTVVIILIFGRWSDFMAILENCHLPDMWITQCTLKSSSQAWKVENFYWYGTWIVQHLRKMLHTKEVLDSMPLFRAGIVQLFGRTEPGALPVLAKQYTKAIQRYQIYRK